MSCAALNAHEHYWVFTPVALNACLVTAYANIILWLWQLMIWLDSEAPCMTCLTSVTWQKVAVSHGRLYWPDYKQIVLKSSIISIKHQASYVFSQKKLAMRHGNASMLTFNAIKRDEVLICVFQLTLYVILTNKKLDGFRVNTALGWAGTDRKHIQFRFLAPPSLGRVSESFLLAMTHRFDWDPQP